MSVLPVVGSELATDSDAAVVGTVLADAVMGDTLDVVDESVGRWCVRMDSAAAWPILHDERSVTSILVRKVAVLTSQFFCCMMLVVMIVSHRWWVVSRMQDVAISLNKHMTEEHLAVGQLWRCPVAWCAVWIVK